MRNNLVTRKLLHASGVVIVIILSISFAPPSLAGGAPQPVSAFYDVTRSAYPMDRVINGEIGIIDPRWQAMDLWRAYRLLTGQPFTDVEKAVWMAEPQAATVSLALDADLETSPIEAWLDARSAWSATLAGSAQLEDRDINPYRSSFQEDEKGRWYSGYANCLEDAFLYALETFERYQQDFGVDSPETRRWVSAQDQVFSNCGEGRTVPNEADSSFSEVERADRAYQIAAAYFYSEGYEAAARRFQQIADDSASPHQHLAAYLSLRATVRQATHGRERDHALLRQVLQVAGERLEQPELAELHDAIGSLRNRASWLAEPDDYRDRILANLKEARTTKDYLEWEKEFQFAINRYSGHFETISAASEPYTLGAAGSNFQRWYTLVHRHTYSNLSQNEAVQHALLQHWREQNSMVWLVALLSALEPGHPALAEVIKAASAIEPGHVAYPTVIYHLMRLSPAARQSVNFEELIKTWPVPDRNRMAELLGVHASSLARWVEFNLLNPQETLALWRWQNRPRFYPSVISDNSEARYFHPEAVAILNEGIPLAGWLEAGQMESAPLAQRWRLLTIGWMRAVVLESDLEPQFAKAIRAIDPEFGGKLVMLDRTESMKANPDLLLILLRSPGLNLWLVDGPGRGAALDGLGNFAIRWWCEGGLPARRAYWPAVTRVNSDSVVAGFLSVAEIDALKRESERMSAVRPAFEWLGEAVLAFAAASPDDSRVPEALHRLVRLTRYDNCEDGGKYSKAAFEILHRDFPGSEWTRKTPYWFN